MIEKPKHPAAANDSSLTDDIPPAGSFRLGNLKRTYRRLGHRQMSHLLLAALTHANPHRAAFKGHTPYKRKALLSLHRVL